MSIVPQPSVYMTRDSVNGVLAPTVDLWPVLPTRYNDGPCITWESLDFEPLTRALSVSLALKKYNVVPDDDRQVIRIG